MLNARYFRDQVGKTSCSLLSCYNWPETITRCVHTFLVYFVVLQVAAGACVRTTLWLSPVDSVIKEDRTTWPARQTGRADPGEWLDRFGGRAPHVCRSSGRAAAAHSSRLPTQLTASHRLRWLRLRADCARLDPPCYAAGVFKVSCNASPHPARCRVPGDLPLL